MVYSEADRDAKYVKLAEEAVASALHRRRCLSEYARHHLWPPR